MFFTPEDSYKFITQLHAIILEFSPSILSALRITLSQMDVLETMKAELEMMRNEKTSIDALLRTAESALEENKRLLSVYKAMAKITDDLLDVVMATGGDNVNENNGQELDDETMKELIEEAMRDFSRVLNQAQSCRSRPTGGRNGGGYDGSSGGDHHSPDGTNINFGKEAGGSGGGNDGGHAQ
ncbi:keratin, type II cytoskeletal 3-like [Gossypium australe]|uniref:Keratin, type II cytoskeletal 3-like n=1 Tax=Gossypium australe TaxID=47621 RepID=A0A5B6VW19_9ROSI|nr:keratin, type II cytoskeletal 3-like [Gossypium australe]